MSTSPTCSRQLKLIQLELQQNHAEAAWKRSLNQSKVDHEVTLLYNLYPHNQCTCSNLHALAKHIRAGLKPACIIVDGTNSCGQGPSLVIKVAMWTVQKHLTLLLHHAVVKRDH